MISVISSADSVITFPFFNQISVGDTTIPINFSYRRAQRQS